MDIFDLSRYQRYNKEYKYLLVAVDVFSRKAFIEPMKIRDSPAVLEAFKELTKIFKPRSIISDHDGAFTSNIFQKYLDQLKIPLTLNA